jgi:hypothetical protein
LIDKYAFQKNDSAVQKLLDEVGLSLLDAANKSEWHDITRPEALAAQARHPGFQPKLPPNGPLLSPKGLHHPHHEQLAPRNGVGNMQT